MMIYYGRLFMVGYIWYDICPERGECFEAENNAPNDRLIVWEVKRDRFSRAKDITASLPHLQVSERTIRRRIEEDSGFTSYWSSKKTFIGENNKRKHVELAIERLHWTTEQWHTVLWSDESPFVLRFHCKRWVWRAYNEKFAPWCMKATVMHDDKIMVWGCFATRGVGRLYLVGDIMRKEQYFSVLDNKMFPSSMVQFPNLEYIY